MPLLAHVAHSWSKASWPRKFPSVESVWRAVNASFQLFRWDAGKRGQLPPEPSTPGQVALQHLVQDCFAAAASGFPSNLSDPDASEIGRDRCHCILSDRKDKLVNRSVSVASPPLVTLPSPPAQSVLFLLHLFLSFIPKAIWKTTPHRIKKN